jgi:hypothetical protein
MERDIDEILAKQIDEFLTIVAKKHLGLETLETRNADHLDFSDQSVESIKAALKDAFRAGIKIGIRISKD